LLSKEDSTKLPENYRELVAELSGYFLCKECCLRNFYSTGEKYIKKWLEQIESDGGYLYLLRAIKDAAQASDRLLELAGVKKFADDHLVYA
jgi:antirestriction protein ArdC